MTTDTLLRAESISKSFVTRSGDDATLALSDVSLEVERGQFVCLVGPSGCGKTTLLKVLDGLVEPTTGRVTINGTPIQSGTGDRAMVFQNANLFPWFDVLRNVGYGLECQGVSKRDALRAAEPFVKMVGLEDFGHHYPHQLSGGMQQRANLARALAVDPAVLLMDEPFSALDAQTRELMQSELLRIWDRTKKTVVFVTHQIDEAIYLADRVIVMGRRPGRIVEDILVTLDRPRDLAIKRTPAFQEYVDRVWSLIEASDRSAPEET